MNWLRDPRTGSLDVVVLAVAVVGLCMLALAGLLVAQALA